MKKRSLAVSIILCAVTFLACAFSLLFNDYKNETVNARAAANDIYWGVSGTTLTLSGSSFPGAQSFNGDTEFNYNTNKVPWFADKENIVTIDFASKIAPKSTAFWFDRFTSLTSIVDIQNLDTSNVTNMACMFENCTSLTTVDVSHFDVSNVKDMTCMFLSCPLTTLDISNWKTSKVEITLAMFAACSSLESLDLKNFDATHVTSILNMFNAMHLLKKIRLSNTLVQKMKSLGEDAMLAFPLYDCEGNVYNAASQLTSGGGYFTTPHSHASYTEVSRKNATCTVAGEIKSVCSEEFCDNIQTVPIPATGHNMQEVTATPPDCGTAGIMAHYHCSKCNKDFLDENGNTQLNSVVDPATGSHDWQLQGNAADPCMGGTEDYECSVCGATKTETVTGAHIPETIPAVTATCTAKGKTAGSKCSVCNEILTAQQDTPKLEHNFGAWHQIKAPTEDEEGEEQRECQRDNCDEKETRAIPKSDHVHVEEVDEAKEPICTETGLTEGKHCSVCGTVTVAQEIVPVKSHTPGTAATCTEPQTCTVCNTELAAAMGHDWATEWSKDGTNHWHICSRCDEKNDEEAHTYDWVITKDPTEDEEGEKEEFCTVCEYVNGNKETIAKLVSDDNGNVSDLPVLPPNQDYDLEIAVKESDSLYNIAGITKGYKVELFVVDGENRTEYDNSKKVTLMLVIPEGMEDDFTLYCRHGEILERVDPATYTVNGKSVTIRTTLPNEYVFNAPSPEPEEPSSGIPWWVWLIVGLVVVAIVGVVIIIIVVAKKKNNDGNGGDTEELKAQLAEQGEKIDELLGRDDGGFNTPVELDENGNVIFK